MNKIETILIFTDAATSPQAEISVGAFVSIEKPYFDDLIDLGMNNLSSQIEKMVIYKKYKTKKSTWSEIKTIINALESLDAKGKKVEIYTDCQSVCDLIYKRKEKLEKNNYLTSSRKVHEHAELYKNLFSLLEKFDFKMIKIKGHNPKAKIVTLNEKIFSVLDKLSRKKLRSILMQ